MKTNFLRRKYGSTLPQNSDGWSAYKRIGELPERYIHMVVNHSENFVDPESSATTNHVESEWQYFKWRIRSDM